MTGCSGARRLAAAAAALTMVALGSPAAAQDEASTGSSRAVAPLVQPAVVYLYIEWSGYVRDKDIGAYLGEYDPVTGEVEPMEFTVGGACTGFVVNPDGWIGSAGHCVDPREGKVALRRAAINWALEYGYYEEGTTFEELDEFQDYTTVVIDETDSASVVKRDSVDRAVTAAWGAAVSGVDISESTPALVESYRKFADGDVALLKVDTDGLNAVPLAEQDVRINDEVQSIGYPAVIDNFTDPDLVPTFNPGTVSSTSKTVADGLLTVLQLSAPISGGMSGGPTVNLNGEVVGVNSASFDGEPFNYAVPVDNLRQLMNGAGVASELSPTTQAYRRGVTALLAEDKAVAVRNLREVVREQPANGLAQEYLSQARDLPDPPAPTSAEDSSGWSTWQWALVIAGILLLVTGAVGAVLWMTRRGRGPRTADAAAAPPGAAAGQSVPAADVAGDGAAPRLAHPTGFGASGLGPRGDENDPQQVSTRPTGHASVVTARELPEQPTADSSRFCTSCGTEAGPAMRFCGRCGARL